MEYVTRGVCGQEGCRERRYYLDNGLWFCRRGHLQEGRQVEEDPDDFGTQGQRHRVKKEKEERSRRTYRGRQAATLFLQAYQLILWKQCYALVHEHGFPEQFEAVVRDLWTFRLRDFELRINESTDDDDDDSEPELFSSQATEAEDSDDLGFKPNSTYLEWPRLLDSVALCYLAAILMRLPICVSDFQRLIIRQDIPYIRALRSVPRDMRDKLPPESIQRLDVNNLPKAEHLHRGFMDLAMYYQRRFGLALPPLNSPLILYRVIKRLAIPIDVYETVKTLQSLVGFQFEYPTKVESNRRRESLNLPEVQLVTLVVISTKLLFPFDGMDRYAATVKEPATLAMDWHRWVQAQRAFNYHHHAGGKIGKDMLIQITDHDVVEMNNNELDEYMDWYENSWLDTYRGMNPVADMFPTGRAEPETQPTSGSDSASNTADPKKALTTLLETVMGDVKCAPVDSTQAANHIRPGSWYRRYRRESQLPETVRVFYELAAQLAAISLRTLIRAVAVTEWRIASWLEDQRREEYINREMQWDTEGGDEDEGEDDGMDELDEQLYDLGVEEEQHV